MKKAITLIAALILLLGGVVNAQITMLSDWDGQTYPGLEISKWSDDYTPDTVANMITDGINISANCLFYPAHIFDTEWGDVGGFLVFKNLAPAVFNENTHLSFKYLAMQSGLGVDETLQFAVKYEKGSDSEVTTPTTNILITAGGTDEWKEVTLEIPKSMLPTDHIQCALIVRTSSGAALDVYYDDVAFIDLTKEWHGDVLVDFGPNDVNNGNITTGPDVNGNYWTNVVSPIAGAETVDFVDRDNNPSIGSLIISSEFGTNGINTGGLLAPDPALLGDLAINTATQDYFYTSTSKGMRIEGLNADSGYVFKMFASRETTTSRITNYTFTGLIQAEGTLTTSGSAIGDGGYNGNNNVVYVSDTIFPDIGGSISINVSVSTGGYAYVNAMIVEQHAAVKPVFPAWVEDVYIDFGKSDGTNGNITVGPDTNGNYWTNMSSGVTGSIAVMTDKANNILSSTLKAATHFSSNGILHGGLTTPDPALLGDIAIATATQDYFYTDNSATMEFAGLDVAKAYVFKIFATRATDGSRISRYTFSGANNGLGELTTSGAGIGDGGYNGNNNVIYESDTILPDQSGKIAIKLDMAAGDYAYIGVMKVEQVIAPAPIVVAMDDGEIIEGAEDGEEITVSISYDGFVGTLTPANWALSNLPTGVSIGSVARIDAANAMITLSGNTTEDYDGDIVDIELTIGADECIASTSVIVSSTDISFTAIVEPASVSMSDDGEILEGEEDGEVISVVLVNDDFVEALSTANWTLTNLPGGVMIGAVTRIDASNAEITLSGNSTEDYDNDITDVSLSIGADELVLSGIAVSATGGVTFIAKIESLVAEFGVNGISIYPNPATDIMFISLSSVQKNPVDVQLFDLQGKMVWQTRIVGERNFEIIVSQFNSGMYMLSVNTDNGIIKGKVVVK